MEFFFPLLHTIINLHRPPLPPLVGEGAVEGVGQVGFLVRLGVKEQDQPAVIAAVDHRAVGIRRGAYVAGAHRGDVAQRLNIPRKLCPRVGGEVGA